MHNTLSPKRERDRDSPSPTSVKHSMFYLNPGGHWLGFDGPTEHTGSFKVLSGEGQHKS